MNATNKNKCVSWSHRVGFAFLQRRVSVALAVGGSAMIGIALASSQLIPLDAKKIEVLVSVSARPRSTLPTHPHHQPIVPTDSQLQASIPTASPDGELEVIRGFALDGLEFAVAGAEVSNQFGPYRQIGNTFSWLAQEPSQPEGDRLVARKQPSGASLVANAYTVPTEREMATWLLQNSPWTR